MGAQEIVALVAGSTLVTAVITSLLSRKRDDFASYTQAYKAVIERVKELEVGVANIEKELRAERERHERTYLLLRETVLYLQAVVKWDAAGRPDGMPAMSEATERLLAWDLVSWDLWEAPLMKALNVKPPGT
jgi:hypothetical protein